MGLRAVFVTLGSDGVLVLTPVRSHIIVPSGSGKVEDTTGCGDVFCAVTVKDLVEGVDLFSAAQAGVELATLATAAKGIEETFELARQSLRGIEFP
jgi:ribokinase